MPGIRTNAAAEVLGVSPNTLRRLGAPLRLPPAEAHGRQPPQLRAGRAADAARRPRPDRQHLLGDRACPPAPGGPRQRRQPARRAGGLRRGRRRPRGRGEPRPAAAGAHGRGAAAAGDRQARRRRRPRGRARVRLALGDRLAARRPPPRLDRLAPGRHPAARRQRRLRGRGGPPAGARPDPAPRRLPGADALPPARRRAARPRPAGARPDRDRALRPRRRHPQRRASWCARSARPASTRRSSASAPPA